MLRKANEKEKKIFNQYWKKLSNEAVAKIRKIFLYKVGNRHIMIWCKFEEALTTARLKITIPNFFMDMSYFLNVSKLEPFYVFQNIEYHETFLYKIAEKILNANKNLHVRY
jgi:hypothetical protein